MPDDETHGQGHSRVTEAAGQVYKHTAKGVQLAWLLNTGRIVEINRCVLVWATYGPDGITCHCTTSPPRSSGSKYGC